ncbi:MAG: ribonuclease P protein component [Ignavibacteriae bacterium]|nr:ribonuclease P protein component [Ignavibacteria bacterium]MBI3365368.1 ribonuclease P protein component [Ignavibacteriota bacterium]
MRHTLTKSEILRGKKNFDLVFQRGKKIEGRYLRCLFVPNAPLSGSEGVSCTVGFAVSRTVKRAVDRNTLKRLLRESYRLNKSILSPAIEHFPARLALVFLYTMRASHSSELPTFREIERDMKKVLGDIVTMMPDL